MGDKFCQRLFLHLLRLSNGFHLSIVSVVYHHDGFSYIEESLNLRNKPNLIMVYELFDVLLNSVC